MDNSKVLFRQWLKIGGAIIFYWCNSIGMIFFNKFLFSSKDLDLNAPLFVTWFQGIITVLFCLIGGITIGDSIPIIGTFPKITFDFKMASNCLLLSVVTAISITFKNLTLTKIEIAFYSVSLAMGTIFTVLFSWMILKQRISIVIMLTCVVIVAGFALSVEQQRELAGLSMVGLFYGVMSSIIGPLSQIQLKRTLSIVNNLWVLTFYTNFNVLFIYPVLSIMLGEYESLMKFKQLTNPFFWVLLTLSGFVGVSLSIAISLQVSLTSPLTSNISGVAKNCIQTVLAVLVNPEAKSGTWWLGNLAILGGSGAYTIVRMEEMKVQTVKVVSSEVKMEEGIVDEKS
ncbi:GDP-fucose transporter 1-like [Oopsacas minuta]|uniref:GDP-fucose transporter 1-like n=1 Tax=Oopsacas minuta TaxID=111878 RepID=A0AAV7K1F3_9METZ|nr:GDP-fucose transporter 1-like [Oopsacas minuta]